MAIEKEITSKKLWVISLSTMVFGIISGILIGGFLMMNHMEIDHVKLHQTKLGYFVFKDAKLYSLDELKTY